MKRIYIIGPGGSGKTTLAADLAAALGLPHVELDAIHWRPNWQEPAVEEFREQVSTALAGETWVVDGNYGKVRDIVMARAELVVWLDFPLWVILPRLIRRTTTRIFKREVLWGTNRETFQEAFLSKDSLFLYVIKTHDRRRRQFEALISAEEYRHIEFVRLRSPRQVRNWFEQYSSSPASPAG